MPLPFSIFSNYRSGLADSSAKPAPADAVSAFQEWLQETAAKEVDAMMPREAKAALAAPPAAPVESVGETAKEIQAEAPAADSLLFRESSSLATPPPLPVEQPVAKTPSGPLAKPEFKSVITVKPAPESRSLAAEPPALPPMPSSTPPPAAGEGWSANQAPNLISSRELAQLKLDIHQEIEEVKNDLFGAAMGVNALKDRLDGLESQVVTQTAEAVTPANAAPAPGSAFQNPTGGATREEVQAWVHEWLQAHLTEAVQAAFEKVLATAAEQVTATLSSNEFFRMPIRPPQPAQEPVPLFSRAPLILSSRPS